MKRVFHMSTLFAELKKTYLRQSQREIAMKFSPLHPRETNSYTGYNQHCMSFLCKILRYCCKLWNVHHACSNVARWSIKNMKFRRGDISRRRLTYMYIFCNLFARKQSLWGLDDYNWSFSLFTKCKIYPLLKHWAQLFERRLMLR